MYEMHVLVLYTAVPVQLPNRVRRTQSGSLRDPDVAAHRHTPALIRGVIFRGLTQSPAPGQARTISNSLDSCPVINYHTRVYYFECDCTPGLAWVTVVLCLCTVRDYSVLCTDLYLAYSGVHEPLDSKFEPSFHGFARTKPNKSIPRLAGLAIGVNNIGRKDRLLSPLFTGSPMHLIPRAIFSTKDVRRSYLSPIVRTNCAV